MSWALALSLLTVVGSVAMMLYSVRSRRHAWRHTVMASATTFAIGCGMLAAVLIPDGVVSTTTQLVFGLTALALLVAEVRAAWPSGGRSEEAQLHS